MEKKICSSCGIEKDLSDFHKWKYGPDGFKRTCKLCRKKETKEYYSKNQYNVRKTVAIYRKNNSERVKETKKKIYERDKLKILEQARIYRKMNRKKISDQSLKRRKSDPIHRLKHLMNSRLRMFLKSRNLSKKNKTFVIVGCTPKQLKEHLQNKFVTGMSWDNFGKWQIDHIIPLSSAKSEKEIYTLCHYTNLQPLWAEDNLKKGNKF